MNKSFALHNTTPLVTMPLVVLALLLCPIGLQGQEKQIEVVQSEFQKPFRLEAEGQIIDIGNHSNYAHAGPCLGDVDGDGVRDLVVGDFPGNFWYFQNVGTDREPRFESKGKLQAGGEDARTPVY